jgi:hypothetical protein
MVYLLQEIRAYSLWLPRCNVNQRRIAQDDELLGHFFSIVTPGWRKDVNMRPYVAALSSRLGAHDS